MDHSPFTGAPERAPAPNDADDGWQFMIVEIFGHRKHAGRAREEEFLGARMLRVDDAVVTFDQAANDGAGAHVISAWSTHRYAPAAIFCVTPTDEATVIRMKKPYAPPARYQLTAEHEEDDDGRPF